MLFHETTCKIIKKKGMMQMRNILTTNLQRIGTKIKDLLRRGVTSSSTQYARFKTFLRQRERTIKKAMAIIVVVLLIVAAIAKKYVDSKIDGFDSISYLQLINTFVLFVLFTIYGRLDITRFSRWKAAYMIFSVCFFGTFESVFVYQASNSLVNVTLIVYCLIMFTWLTIASYGRIVEIAKNGLRTFNEVNLIMLNLILLEMYASIVCIVLFMADPNSFSDKILQEISTADLSSATHVMATAFALFVKFIFMNVTYNGDLSAESLIAMLFIIFKFFAVIYTLVLCLSMSPSTTNTSNSGNNTTNGANMPTSNTATSRPSNWANSRPNNWYNNRSRNGRRRYP